MEEIIPLLSCLASCVYPGLYTKTNQIEDAIDRKVDEADVICQFVNGKQFDIFKRIDTLKKGNQANLTYVSAELIKALDEIYNSATPWSLMAKGKATIDAITNEIKEKQEAAIADVIIILDTKLQALTGLSSYGALQANQQQQITAMFEVLKSKAQSERYIGNLIAMNNQVTDTYNKCLDSINHWIEEKQKAQEEEARKKAQQQNGDGHTIAQPNTPHVIHKVVSKQKAMAVTFDKPVLETKEDVEKYVDALKTQLMHFIEQNNNIMLN